MIMISGLSVAGLPETMIVLGAGPIAMEMAQAFQRLGTRVRVIPIPPWPR